MTTDADTVTAATNPPRTRRATTTAVTPAAAPKRTSKSDTVIKRLLRAKGATPTELIAATGWQPHSLRAFLSGLRKKGRAVVRNERKGGEIAYHIVAAPAGAVEANGAGEGLPSTVAVFESAALAAAASTADA